MPRPYQASSFLTVLYTESGGRTYKHER